MNMQEAIAKVIAGEDLEQEQMLEVMRLIMTGEATEAQIGGFLVGLRIKGETVAEVVAAATVMRELATRVNVAMEGLIDTCGTGGSGSNKFNVSTASAFVAAAAGARVAKHGNRHASSRSGSADVLEEAGAAILLSPDHVARCINDIGIGFLFAPSHHGAMKHAIGPRREMVARTIFNMLGPLTNPAGARRQLLGIYDKALVRPLAEVLKTLGSEHVLVVSADDGLDEISIGAPTAVAELKNGEIREYQITPEQLGIKSSSLKSLVIEDSAGSLALVRAALSGKHRVASDIVTLNAGAAIYVSGQTQSLAAGVEMAREVIGAGLAEEKMQEFVDFTARLVEVGCE